jgi:hypothetical protein
MGRVNWARVAWILCAAVAALHVLAFLAVALSRVAYPYDLEWMEGGQLVQSYEILAGHFPYEAPSADYIAFPYQPLYSAVVAALGWIFGLSLPLARSVSIASTLACAGLVGRAVWRETGARSYGLLAGATVLSLYRVIGFWFDLGRVDSLFMALLVGGLYAARYIEGPWRSCLASAALLVLAYKTKQLALPFCVLVPPLLAPKDRRAALAFAPLVVVPLAIDFWLSQRASGGWFSFYVNHVPRAQPYQPAKFLQFPLVVASQIPVLAALVVVASLRLVREGPWSAKLRETWTLATILGAAVSVAAWARPGGYANNLMTTYVFAVIPAFVELHRMVSRATERGVLLLSALGLQLLRLGYNPLHQIPGRADYEAGAMFVDRIRAVEGPVLVPQRPWLAVLAGKGPSYHANAYWEWAFLQGADRTPDDLRRRLEGGFYRVVALDADPRGLAKAERSVPEVMDRNYVCDRTLALPGRGLGSFAGASMPGPAVLCRFAEAR